MTAALTDFPRLGEGVYSFPQAARILSRRDRPLTVRQVRYWLRSGLVPATYRLHGDPILTFHDLISLEVVGRFLDAGWSLQRVRRVEAVLRQEFSNAHRPFAYRLFYTDGRSLWARYSEDDDEMLELVGRRSSRTVKPLAWADAIESFAEQIRFDGPGQTASAWELTPWIEINPEIQFGAPVVRGTRVPVSTVAANLEAGTLEEVADWYDLSFDEVQGVRDYVALN